MPVNPAKPVTRSEQAQKVVRPYGRLLALLGGSAAVLLLADYSLATLGFVLAGEVLAWALR